MIPSSTRVASAFLRSASSRKLVRVIVPQGPGFVSNVKVYITTRGLEAEILLEDIRGHKMLLFNKGGGKLEELVDGGWVQDFDDLDAALLAFARKVS